MSLREQKKVRARSDILAAANTLIARKGYENTTMREIADAANLSYQTLYNYFPSKALIVQAMLTDVDKARHAHRRDHRRFRRSDRQTEPDHQALLRSGRASRTRVVARDRSRSDQKRAGVPRAAGAESERGFQRAAHAAARRADEPANWILTSMRTCSRTRCTRSPTSRSCASCSNRIRRRSPY